MVWCSSAIFLKIYFFTLILCHYSIDFSVFYSIIYNYINIVNTVQGTKIFFCFVSITKNNCSISTFLPVHINYHFHTRGTRSNEESEPVWWPEFDKVRFLLKCGSTYVEVGKYCLEFIGVVLQRKKLRH